MLDAYKGLRAFFGGLKYERGVCKGMLARRNRRTKEVQFVLWKSGQHGHTSDYWIAFDKSHWSHFDPS